MGGAADGGAAGLKALSEQDKQMFDLINSDPLDLKNTLPEDYTNWASVLSHVLLEKEEQEGGAHRALVHLMKLTHNRLMEISKGDTMPPVLALQDKVFHDGKGEKVAIPQTSITGLSMSKVFFNYAPCIFSSGIDGVSLSAPGLTFSPSLFYFNPSLANIGVTGLNLAPSAILVAPNVANVGPVGVNVAPALASINPTGVAITPGGINIAPALANIQPLGVNVNPLGINVSPVFTTYNPVGAGDGAQEQPDSNGAILLARREEGGPKNVSNALQTHLDGPSQTVQQLRGRPDVTPQPVSTG